MSTSSLVETLRSQIEKKHRDALQALETLAVYLDESARLALVKHEVEPHGSLLSRRIRKNIETRASRIFRAIGHEFKTVEQIEAETGLPQNAVRAALYSKSASTKLNRKKIGTKMAFRLKVPPVEMPDHEDKTATISAPEPT
jgi:hypothetical protein